MVNGTIIEKKKRKNGGRSSNLGPSERQWWDLRKKGKEESARPANFHGNPKWVLLG